MKLLNVLLLACGLMVGGSVMGQEAAAGGLCSVKAGEGLKVYDKCKAGDVLYFEDFNASIVGYVCDYSRQVIVISIGNGGSSLAHSCIYIGYVRKVR